MGKNAIGGSGLVAIDFEFCAYNYRAYDIANHWAEWIYDYGNKEYPYYFVNHNKAPTIDQKVNNYSFFEHFKNWIIHVLEEMIDVFASAFWLQIEFLQRYTHEIFKNSAQVEDILGEIDFFSAVPDIVWALWCIDRAVHSDIKFGYWHYAAHRMHDYLRRKETMKETIQQTDVTSNGAEK